MKKLLIAGLALMFMVGVAGASQVQTDIIDTDLTNTSPAVEGDLYVGSADKVTFFVTYDSARTTAAVTMSVTAAASIDGVNWTDISWFDVAGGGIPQTSETIGTDSTYVGWFFNSLTTPQIRIRATLPNYAVYGPETSGIVVTVVEKK